MSECDKDQEIARLKAQIADMTENGIELVPGTNLEKLMSALADREVLMDAIATIYNAVESFTSGDDEDPEMSEELSQVMMTIENTCISLPMFDEIMEEGEEEQ